MLTHEFFKTKTVTTGQKTAALTTAETAKSRVESLVIGASGLQLKTKIVGSDKKPAKGLRSSIDGNGSQLEPIMEDQDKGNVQEVNSDAKAKQDALAISVVINQAFEEGYKQAQSD